MNKIKMIIGISLLFLVVGIAAVSTQLDFNINASLASNSEDFDVYFSDIIIDGEQNHKVLENKRQFSYNYTLVTLGHTYTVFYEITNASRNYDADVSVSCTLGDDYVSYENDFDDSTYLAARSSRTGTLIVTQTRSNSGSDLESSVVCSITATAVERNSSKNDKVKEPFTDPYEIGREIYVNGDWFNIIDVEDDYVYLLAQNAFDSSGKLSSNPATFTFSTRSGWAYSPGPKEIDLETYASTIYDMLDAYSMDLYYALGVGEVEVDLITLKQLEKLGCTIESDYSYSDDVSCNDSPYKSLIFKVPTYWTKSASSDDSSSVWIIESNDLAAEPYSSDLYFPRVRPVVKVNKLFFQ